MFIIPVGSKLYVPLLHKIATGETPTASTLRIFKFSAVSPYYTQVGADIDVLVSGGNIVDSTATPIPGLYGVEIDTSGYTEGQYLLWHSATIDGNTFDATFEVQLENTTATSVSALESSIKSLIDTVGKHVAPDNKGIEAIAKTVGAFNNNAYSYNPELGKSVYNAGAALQIVKTIDQKVDIANNEIKKSRTITDSGFKSNSARGEASLNKMKADVSAMITNELNNALMTFRSDLADVVKVDDLTNESLLRTADLVARTEISKDILNRVNTIQKALLAIAEQMPTMVAQEFQGLLTQRAGAMASDMVRGKNA